MLNNFNLLFFYYVEASLEDSPDSHSNINQYNVLNTNEDVKPDKAKRQYNSFIENKKSIISNTNLSNAEERTQNGNVSHPSHDNLPVEIDDIDFKGSLSGHHFFKFY